MNVLELASSGGHRLGQGGSYGGGGGAAPMEAAPGIDMSVQNDDFSDLIQF